MLEEAKSCAIPRQTLAGAAPRPPEADPAPLPEGLSRSAPGESLYSIRVAESPGAGVGPVGYQDDEPICAS